VSASAGSVPIPSTEHVVLIGMMGSGKTTLGKLLAGRLGRPLLDSDAMVESRVGKTVAQMFAEQGEAAFRAEESRALADALASTTPAIIAAAGGTVIDAGNRRRIADGGMVVWLRADPAILAGRIRPGDHRPLLAEDAAGTLRRLDADRRPLYASVADVIIDVDQSNRSAIIGRILDAMNDRAVAVRPEESEEGAAS
jgi:shikimate kinase